MRFPAILSRIAHPLLPWYALLSVAAYVVLPSSTAPARAADVSSVLYAYLHNNPWG